MSLIKQKNYIPTEYSRLTSYFQGQYRQISIESGLFFRMTIVKVNAPPQNGSGAFSLTNFKEAFWDI